MNLNLSQIGQALACKRVYSFDEAQGERWLRAKLAFESRSGNFLWKKPMEQLKQMLFSSNKKIVMELIMAMGKTFYGIPSTDYMLADEDSLVINIWPGAFAKTAIPNIAAQSRLLFDQPASAAHFVRHRGWDLATVRALHGNLKAMINDQGQYNMTKEDAQAFELKFLELGIMALKGNRGKDERKILTYQKECLRMFRKVGKAVPDEAHETFHCRKELNYPFGKPKSLEDKYVLLINEVMHKLATIPELKELVPLKKDKWHKIPEDFFHEKIRPILAKEMSKWARLEVEPEKRDEFMAYISGQLNYKPGFVEESRHNQEMGLLKGMLTKLLPHSLNKIIDVNFCGSEKFHEEFAKPSEGNMSPQEQSLIQNPFEAYVKTCMMTLWRKIDPGRMACFLSKLKASGELEKGN